jgi:hypothetical protein
MRPHEPKGSCGYRGGTETWWWTMRQAPSAFSKTLVPRSVTETSSPEGRRARNSSSPVTQATSPPSRRLGSGMEAAIPLQLANRFSKPARTASQPASECLLGGWMART